MLLEIILGLWIGGSIIAMATGAIGHFIFEEDWGIVVFFSGLFMIIILILIIVIILVTAVQEALCQWPPLQILCP